VLAEVVRGLLAALYHQAVKTLTQEAAETGHPLSQYGEPQHPLVKILAGLDGMQAAAVAELTALRLVEQAEMAAAEMGQLEPKELKVVCRLVLQTQVAAAVGGTIKCQALIYGPGHLAVQASSSFVTLARNAAQAARSRSLAATPTTPSHRPAHSRHNRRSTWHILQK
jgi:hypothetical protein